METNMRLFKYILLPIAFFIACSASVGNGFQIPEDVPMDTSIKDAPMNTIFEDAPTIWVRQGYLKGMKERTLKGKEFYSYKSIPYAQPPVGRLRFKAPVPTLFWPGILSATKEPDFCMQKMYVQNLTDQEPNTLFYANEDCLYLNVYTPKTFSPSSQFPVMFYIHGGSFLMGGAQKMPPYVLMDEDIVLVVIQYRLGIFGFLSTEDFTLPGNMGLKDQQLALRWVNENIASFGGDINSITVFGESAGSASVHFQILSPGSKGLFNRAIMMSGTAVAPFTTYSNHREYARETGKHFGCTLEFGTQFYLLCMQRVEASELQDYAFSQLKWEYFSITTLPRVDGEFLPDFPEVLMNDGQYNKVDLLCGMTRDEAVFVLELFFNYPQIFQELQKQFDVYGPISLIMENEPNPVELARTAYHHYLKKDVTLIPKLEEDEGEKEQLLRLYSDRILKDNFDLALHFFLKHSDIALYLYEFDYVGKFTTYNYVPALKNHKWAAHTDDLLYLFAGGPIANVNMTDENDLKVRKFMVTTWTNFARTGNPTPDGYSIKWERANKDEVHQLNLTEDPKMDIYDHKETRKFWASLDTWQNRLLSYIEYDD